MIFRLVSVFAILALLCLISFCQGYFEGNDDGYSEAMSDVFFNIQTPENYINSKLKQAREEYDKTNRNK